MKYSCKVLLGTHFHHPGIFRKLELPYVMAAVKAVRNGVSIRKAAAYYSISKSALQRYVQIYGTMSIYQRCMN
ncbi:unnamed protein product [Acanthoscelides obtectus]|uniref:HTH psq-type domain-containing protein n=1 Tax=Acanthoscelides obtectus TaxID=200917 RepID=A0A9P0K0J8_ACAOB|nr:unnamed protein product [Acanthoscelides obtectus]CAK1669705.1 hypothetical protein AOBTE_LOCUS27189 [Acanthoscelides obtectus]